MAGSGTIACSGSFRRRLGDTRLRDYGGNIDPTMTSFLTLFDQLDLTERDEQKGSQSMLDSLKYSTRLEIAEIRDRLQSWFKRFPVEAQRDIRNRILGDDGHTRQGAVFELLVHELLVRLDCTVEVHPRISSTGSRPDFLAHHGDRRFYIEATVVDPKGSLSASRPLEDDVVAKINEIESPHFHIFARVQGELSRALSRRKVIKPFTNLLRDHDPDDVQRLIDWGGPYSAPSAKVECGNWSLQGWLEPLPPERRGDARPKSLVSGPARSGMIDISTPIQRAIQKKARKYGHLDAPLVVAVNARDAFLDEDDEIQALFGKEQVTFTRDRPDLPVKLTRKADGVWIKGGYKPRYTRLDGVLIFRNISPWNLCDSSNCLYVIPHLEYTGIPDVLYRLSHARLVETQVPHQYEIKRFKGENIGRLFGVCGADSLGR